MWKPLNVQMSKSNGVMSVLKVLTKHYSHDIYIIFFQFDLRSSYQPCLWTTKAMEESETAQSPQSLRRINTPGNQAVCKRDHTNAVKTHGLSSTVKGSTNSERLAKSSNSPRFFHLDMM